MENQTSDLHDFQVTVTKEEEEDEVSFGGAKAIQKPPSTQGKTSLFDDSEEEDEDEGKEGSAGDKEEVVEGESLKENG